MRDLSGQARLVRLFVGRGLLIVGINHQALCAYKLNLLKSEFCNDELRQGAFLLSLKSVDRKGLRTKKPQLM